MMQLELTRARALKLAVDLIRLLARLLVRVAVLLQPVDAVRHLRPAQTREQVAREDQADVHHGSIESLLFGRIKTF